MLELTKVEKSYDGVRVLGPLSLRVDARETVALLGPSGCGKSTLLRLILALQTPDCGTIRFERIQLDEKSAQSARRRMGYVIQDGGLFPHLTSKENVALMARHLGWSDSRVDRRTAELCELTRLPADALERSPSEISGGQRQRVGLMRALMLDPDILLLDEPLSALDPLVRRDLQSDLREIFAALGKTVVLVTHDVAEAAFFADRIVLMRDGRVVQSGRIAELLERPSEEFVTRFIEAQRSSLPEPAA